MVTAFRVSFVGEHGYEIHVENDDAERVYGMIRRQGQGHGLVNAGYRAMDSLSAEKGYCLKLGLMLSRGWMHFLKHRVGNKDNKDVNGI